MYFYKEIEIPVYYMIDMAGMIMIKIIATDDLVSINNIWNAEHIKRMLNAFMLDNQIAPIYEDITEADFYKIYHDVQATIENNFQLFELHHFGMK